MQGKTETMASLSIEINVEWIKTETDLSKCAACEQVIYGGMFEMYLFVNQKPQELPTYRLCESCYELIKDKK